MLPDLVVSAWHKAWNERDSTLRTALTLVAEPLVEQSPAAPSMQSLCAHLEFRDGARFRLRYSFAPTENDNETFIAVENDMGLQFGFLDDINAYLLDLDFNKQPSDIITQVLSKAVRMHQRASAHTAQRTANVSPVKAPPVGSVAKFNAESLTNPSSGGAVTATGANAIANGSTGSSASASLSSTTEDRNRSGTNFGHSRYATTALMKQLNLLQKQDTLADGFSAVPYPDDLYTWDVKLFFDHKSTELGQDLAKLQGVDYVSLEFKFPSTFPTEPPVVRLISPVITGGHVTRHGAICMELLSAHGWTPANGVDAVCIQIRALLVAGNARIDQERPLATGKYTLEGALRDSSRVFDQHGWNRTPAPRRVSRPGPPHLPRIENGI